MNRPAALLLALLGSVGCGSAGNAHEIAGDDARDVFDDASTDAPLAGDFTGVKPNAAILFAGQPASFDQDDAVFADGAPEVCGDLLDNDGDGLLDCQDPDCAASCAPGTAAVGDACTVSSDCSAAGSNAPFCLDEAGYGFPGGYCSQLCEIGAASPCGGDGLCLDVGLGTTGVCFDGCATDECSRGACMDAHAIDPAQPSNTMICYPYEDACTGGVDDDGDGLVDCDDPDCGGSMACVAQTCAAGTVFPAELPPAGVSGDSYSTYALSGSCVRTDGWEQIFVFTADATQAYRVTMDSATDQGVYVLDACGPDQTELACANEYGAGITEDLVFSATAGSTYYVVVDSASPNDAGPFTLTITAV